MSASIIAPQPRPMPDGLRELLPNPRFPLAMSDRLSSAIEDSRPFGNYPIAYYRKAQVLPQDPEWDFVWKYFYHDKPTQHDIKRIFAVLPEASLETFCADLRIQEAHADQPSFAPRWRSEGRRQELRERVFQRFEETAKTPLPLSM